MEVGISESYCREKLEAGEFQIVFDGVDEIINLRENIHRIFDFIKSYNKSNFTRFAYEEKSIIMMTLATKKK